MPKLSWSALAPFLLVAALGALLVALASQIPVRHTVDVGGLDAAYVQGFYDPERAESPDLAGSDGRARWTGAAAYLLFPQAGLPAEAILHVRGREDAPVELRLLQNDTDELARVVLDANWQTVHVPLQGDRLKPEDVVVALRTEAAPRSPGDPRLVGVLLDRVEYVVGPAPILPAPAQVLWGALIAVLCRALGLRRRNLGLVLGAMTLVFLFGYRMQPIYPFPLRGLLPGLAVLLAAMLAIRHLPMLAQRVPALPDGAALAGMALWSALLFGYAQQHVTLALPGVEADFRVFALRSERLNGVFQADGNYSAAEDGVLRADGFYNLGYPFLLWAMRPFTQDNPFLAARVLGVSSGVLLLFGCWWLTRNLFGRIPALLAVVLLALNALTVQYALSLGTDLPFAAFCTLALACLLHPSPRRRWLIVAGVLAGAAMLLRHPGILLLPIGWLCQALIERTKEQRTTEQSSAQSGYSGNRQHRVDLPTRTSASGEKASRVNIWNRHAWSAPILIFTLAFVLACLPQFVVNLRDTGELLHNQQAKNIWLAVYGNSDWSQWSAVSNNISLADVLAADPGRFLTNWANNLRAFVGTGSDDTSEFGRAIQLRLLGFPANWLALAGLLGWLVMLVRRTSGTAERSGIVVLLVWLVLYVAAVAVGLGLPRFFLVLAPVYAVAAAWALGVVLPGVVGVRGSIAAALLLLGLLWGNLAIGASAVLDRQPANEVAAVRLIEALPPGSRVIVRVPPRVPLGKYSAIAQRVVTALPDDAPDTLRASGARALLWSEALGPPPPVGPLIGRAGEFLLLDLTATPR